MITLNDTAKILAIASAVGGSGGGGSGSLPAYYAGDTPPEDTRLLWIDTSDNTGLVENDVLTPTEIPLNATDEVT